MTRSSQGVVVLDQVRNFLSDYVVYPDHHSAVAHTLWIAHAWLMDRWDSTPRIAFISPEPGSGKSRALEVTAPLVPRPVHAVNATPAYLFRKVSDEAGPPTILFDEIDTLFGPRAKDNEEVRGMLNAGHRRGATAGRALVKGKEVVTEELPAYAAVALAGLNDLPDTIRARSIVVTMRRRAPKETVKPWRMRTGEAEAAPIREALKRWADTFPKQVDWPVMPATVEDRNADVWEALIAVADHAGGHWPSLAREAAVAAVAAAKNRPQTIGVQLLSDIRGFFHQDQNQGTRWFATDTLLDHLNNLDESPWGNIRGNPLDSRSLARRLRPYDIRPAQQRTGEGNRRGYTVGSFADSFARYLPPLLPESSATSATTATTLESRAKTVADKNTKTATSATPATQNPRNHADVALVADVADKSQSTRGADEDRYRDCFGGCGQPLEKATHPGDYCHRCKKKQVSA